MIVRRERERDRKMRREDEKKGEKKGRKKRREDEKTGEKKWRRERKARLVREGRKDRDPPPHSPTGVRI